MKYLFVFIKYYCKENIITVYFLFQLDKVLSPKMNARPKSVCEGMLTRNFLNENPPPIPPPPLIYTIPTTQISGINKI